MRALGYEDDTTRDKQLAKAVDDITKQLARTEANTTALPVYAGPIPPEFAVNPRDDGISFLRTDQYVRMRLEDNLAFYRRKTIWLETQLRRMHVWILLAGAAGTLLAALGGSLVIWITLSTALASALMLFMSHRQIEATLVGYNQTASDLDNILSWWTSLEPAEQAMRRNIEALSKYTEQVLADEMAGWSQRMNDVLENLRDGQATERGEGRAAAPSAAAREPALASPEPPPDRAPEPPDNQRR